MRKTFIHSIVALTSVLIFFVGFTAPTFAASSHVATSQHRLFSSSEFFTPSLSNNGNPGWAHFTDSNGHASAYTDSNGSNGTSQAVWNFPIRGNCDYLVYVPAQNATATITYGFFRFGIKVETFTLNQRPVAGFVDIGVHNTINSVQFSNNNGEHGTRIGVGVSNSLDLLC